MASYYPRLRDLREDADLTQDELVQELKMPKTTYTNYEQGKREPPFSLIILPPPGLRRGGGGAGDPVPL